MTMTEERKTYNGYANYETWAVALWIDNDRVTHDQQREMTARAWAEAETHPEYFTLSQAARYQLADALKTWVSDDLVPDLGATLAADLLGAALDEVDWAELADNYLSEVEGYQTLSAERKS